MKIKVEFEVAETDELGCYAWQEAVDHLAKKGDRWRLPSKDELNLMYQQRESIGGFVSAWYWSSSEARTGYVWGQVFGSGDQGYGTKGSEGRVRAVRDIKLYQ